jgi:3-oxoadipate enol-lactonase
MNPLHHAVTGDGPALLLLHAGVCDSRMWARQLDDLARDHQVITADLRGYGETPLEPGSRYSDAGDVLDLLDLLGVDSVAVVAASYGGHVALQAATMAPRRFTRLVLLAPPVDGVEPTPDLVEFVQQENRLLEAGDVDAATDLNVRTWLGPDADEATRDQVRTMQAHAFQVQLAAGDDIKKEEHEVRPELIQAPVRLFTGAHDLAFFHRSADHLVAELADVQHTELDWAGHLPSLERPDETTVLIRSALLPVASS